MMVIALIAAVYASILIAQKVSEHRQAKMRAFRDNLRSCAALSRPLEHLPEPPKPVVKRKRGRPRKNPIPQPAEPVAEIMHEPVQEPAPAPAAKPSPVFPVGNNAFAGHTVAFTGTLPGMTRAEAIKAVEKNGGKAFETMPASTTLLVVGDKPGLHKLQLADKWPSCRKINAMEFNIMLKQPLTFEPDEFVEYLKARMERGDVLPA